MLDFCIAKLRRCLEENNIAFDLPTQEWVENCLRLGLLPGFNTPRTVLRFINSCTFAIPLMRGLVNTGDLILMEGVKQLYPDLYTFIRINPNNLVTRNGRIWRVRTTDFVH